MKKDLKILVYDIETTPNLAYVWGRYEQNVLSYASEWEILCFSYKWLGQSKVHSVSKRGKKDDRAVCQKLWKLLDEADVVVAHNGDNFDNKKAQARFAFWGLGPPAPFRSVDTRKLAKKHFMFNSNKLDELGQHLGLGRKVHTGGFELWLGCMRGDRKAWAKMLKYNEQDVRLLERVYEKLKPWFTSHPNVAALKGRPDGCPTCGSNKLKSYGWKHTNTRSYVRYRCISCGAFSRGRESVKTANRAG